MLLFRCCQEVPVLPSGVDWLTSDETKGSFTHAEESGFHRGQQYDAGPYDDSFRVCDYSAQADSMTKGE